MYCLGSEKLRRNNINNREGSIRTSIQWSFIHFTKVLFAIISRETRTGNMWQKKLAKETHAVKELLYKTPNPFIKIPIFNELSDLITCAVCESFHFTPYNAKNL